MSSSALKKPVDDTRIGEHAAKQPLSGVDHVEASFAVNGVGHGGYVRTEEAKKASPEH